MSTHAHAKCHVHFFHRVKFFFWCIRLIGYSVLGQRYCSFQGEESSINILGNMIYPAMSLFFASQPCIGLLLNLPWPCLYLALTMLELWWLESVLYVPRNISLKFHQNQVSNSWNILDIGKYSLVECCLDKCHRNSWNLF